MHQSAVIKTKLTPFGANLFYNNFSKEQNDGVHANYHVTFGDRISVHSWGALEVNNVLTVDSQGNIFLPEIGPVHVAGVRNKDLTAVLDKEVRTVYKDHFKIYTNLLSAKPINIYVTGFVQNPGRYPGLPVDSILYYLNKAGGIAPELGTYRDIDIVRNGEVVCKYDLYEFLLHGQIKPFQFSDNDVVLIKRRGAFITLQGDVAQESTLEFFTRPFMGAEILNIVPESSHAKEIVVTGMREGEIKSFTYDLEDFVTQSLEDGDQGCYKA